MATNLQWSHHHDQQSRYQNYLADSLPTEIFLFVAVVYFVFCSSLDLIANRWVKSRDVPGQR